MNKKIAIVTGASGGIGKEFTKRLLQERLDEIWIIARNQEKLMQLKEEHGDKIVVLPLDLSVTKNYETIEQLLKSEKPVVQYLINNASIAKMGSYEEFTINEIESTINLNCVAPVVLSKLCISYMEKGSCILNISSASAFQPNPYINLYASSKSFEKNYSRALHVELKKKGITATAVCPGWVDTEMISKTIHGQEVRFPGIVTAKKVVDSAMQDTKKGKDLSICSFYLKCQYLNVKLLPEKVVMWIWMNGLKKYL